MGRNSKKKSYNIIYEGNNTIKAFNKNVALFDLACILHYNFGMPQYCYEKDIINWAKSCPGVKIKKI